MILNEGLHGLPLMDRLAKRRPFSGSKVSATVESSRHSMLVIFAISQKLQSVKVVLFANVLPSVHIGAAGATNPLKVVRLGCMSAVGLARSCWSDLSRLASYLSSAIQVRKHMGLMRQSGRFRSIGPL